MPRGFPSNPVNNHQFRILLLDDDPDARAYHEALLRSRFPSAILQARLEPVVEGQWDLIVFDDDFAGQKRACRIAIQVAHELPQCKRVAISGQFTEIARKALESLGCDAVCDKADPKQFQAAIERIASSRAAQRG